MPNIESDRKTGLALGGGAILGAAHIGVLQALEDAGIELCAIAGTSIGAMIAALYAFGKSPREIAEIAGRLDWLDLSGVSVSRFGLLSNEKLGEQFEEAVGDVCIEDAEIALAIVATDVASSEKVVLTSGPVAPAIRASACIPGIVSPVEIDGRTLVDGGLIENVPISPLRELGAETVIAVDLNAKREYRKPDGLVDVLLNALDIALDHATRIVTEDADLLVTPELNAYSRIDIDNVNDLIEEGYRAAREALGESGEPAAEDAGPPRVSARQPAASKNGRYSPSKLELKIPPLVLALVAAVSMWFSSLAGTFLEFPFWLRVGLASGLASAGLGIAVAALVQFRRAGTTVNPLSPDRASELVTDGIYRLSRNPMYLALALGLVALAVWLSSLISLLFAGVFVAWMDFFQIRPEERELRAKYGERYEDYKGSVRRWL